MQPSSVTALDVIPYNTFTLRCVASAPANVVLQKSFVWRNGSSVITDNGNNVLITNHNTAMPVSTSELTVNEPSVGSYTFYCTVSMSVHGGLEISAFTTGTASVEGMIFIRTNNICYYQIIDDSFRTKNSNTAYHSANCEHHFRLSNSAVVDTVPLLYSGAVHHQFWH